MEQPDNRRNNDGFARDFHHGDHFAPVGALANPVSFGFAQDSDSNSPQTHVVMKSYRRETTPESMSFRQNPPNPSTNHEEKQKMLGIQQEDSGTIDDGVDSSDQGLGGGNCLADGDLHLQTVALTQKSHGMKTEKSAKMKRKDALTSPLLAHSKPAGASRMQNSLISAAQKLSPLLQNTRKQQSALQATHQHYNPARKQPQTDSKHMKKQRSKGKSQQIKRSSDSQKMTESEDERGEAAGCDPQKQQVVGGQTALGMEKQLIYLKAKIQGTHGEKLNDVNTKKPGSHVSVDYESKLMKLVEMNDSENHVLDHLQIALEADGELYRVTDGEIIECDQEQAETLIRQTKLQEIQRLEELGVGFVKGDDDWQIEDPDPDED